MNSKKRKPLHKADHQGAERKLPEIKPSLPSVAGLIYGEGPDCPVPDEVWYQEMELE